ncbi:hypothetical protein B296_00014366 [Ensete ventricosum]|uniref:Uncharacterized protein n=1 Tax=Ensete ventricosum TaxID=4639 RepID=A0A427AY13_ENSVE|nr:hypothetical protein B296_00014366 [Ensete ventricosum]
MPSSLPHQCATSFASLQPYCYCLLPLEPIVDAPAAPLLAALTVALVVVAVTAAPLRRPPLSHLLLPSASPSSFIAVGPLPVNHQQRRCHLAAPHPLGPHDATASYPHCQCPPHFLLSLPTVVVDVFFFPLSRPCFYCNRCCRSPQHSRLAISSSASPLTHHPQCLPR